MDNESIFFKNNDSVYSNRIIYTSSAFARSNLIYLQETGTLQALFPHKNARTNLQSCLFFIVLNGSGTLTYEGETYNLLKNHCVFIDCQKTYCHETRLYFSGDLHNNTLWSLQWCHFYSINMSAIYRKYLERGGKPVFYTKQLGSYRKILDDLYTIASSSDYVRDMRIHEKLSSLLILLMEDAWDESQVNQNTSVSLDIQKVRDYLDANYRKKITLDDLAACFFINKYYLMKLFKDRYGVTINAYLNQVRVTWIKQQLRFTDKTVEALAAELQIEPAYLSRLFRKIEGVSPTYFRKSWRGNS